MSNTITTSELQELGFTPAASCWSKRGKNGSVDVHPMQGMNPEDTEIDIEAAVFWPPKGHMKPLGTIRTATLRLLARRLD